MCLPTLSVNTDIYKKMPKVTKLNLNPTRQLDKEWLGEAYINVIEGKNDKDSVGLSSFATNSEKFSNLARARKGEVSLLDEHETLMGYNGITIDFMIDETAMKAFMDVEENADMRYYVENFIDMWDYIKRDKGNNIWILLNLSMQEDKIAQSKLRAVNEEFERLEEILTYVIKNPRCFQALEELFKYSDEVPS